jgi:hypothetical protein
MTDEKHKEIIRNNFIEWAKITFPKNSLNHELAGILYLSWIEATRQADERHAIK